MSDGATATPSGQAPDERRPNIVLIVTDQHRNDHVGWVDDRFVTPNLDRLAASGRVFDRAVVSNPICMPNRASLATGRMPSVHGTRYNGLPLDDRARTFMHALADAGYRTGLVGKAHFQNMGDHPELVERVVDQRPVHDAVGLPDDGWDTWELKVRYDDPDADHDVPEGWYGFEHVELAIDHGDAVGGHYVDWLRERGVDAVGLRGIEHALEIDEHWSEVRRPALDVEHHHSVWVGERSAAFVTDPDDRPFFLQMSFPDPHHPFTPPGERFDRYDHRDLEPPASFARSHEDSMPHLRAMAERRGKQPFHLAAFSPSLEQYQRALAAEIALIEMIDEAVGTMLAALERAGRRQDTIVVFTSDHGDMFGDHGLMLKTAMHYRAVREVPLVIAGPGIRPGGTSSLVSTLDLAPTICSLADVEAFWGIQGHDLSPSLADPTSSVRDHVLVEEDQMFDLARVGRPLRMRTLVTDHARITRYAGAERGELYDLAADPDELDDLGRRRDLPLAHEMTERLADSLADHADHDRRPTHMA